MENFRFRFIPKGTDNYTLKRMAKMYMKHVQGSTMAIRVKTKPESGEVKTVHSTSIRLADSIEFPPLNLPKDMPIKEELDKILDRCELLTKLYDAFLKRATLKLNMLGQMYDKKDHNIYVTRSAPMGDESSEDEEPFTHFDPDAISDTEEEEENDFTENKPNPLYAEKTTKEDVHEYPKAIGDNLLIIGPNGTRIQQKDYEALLPKGANGATRILCDIIFGDETLATHSLTGTHSRFFKVRDNTVKEKLDPLKAEDIIKFIASKFSVSQQMVRSIITLKCADSAKNLRRRLARAHIM